MWEVGWVGADSGDLGDSVEPPKGPEVSNDTHRLTLTGPGPLVPEDAVLLAGQHRA